MLKTIIILLLILPPAVAIQINQVLYDPTISDTGGEAIELYNEATVDVSLDSWTIATSTSDHDVTFPKNAIIPAQGYFLVTDVGWNTSRDDTTWRMGDYEETMTLPNHNSGIALKNKNGTLIDAVGWGNATTGLFLGTPATEVPEGKALKRTTTTTRNNKQDFIAQEPSFDAGESITISVEITQPPTTINDVRILEDDLPTPGTQLKPTPETTRNITILADITGGNSVAEFLGKFYQMQKINGTHQTQIPLAHSLAPGNYSIKIKNEDVVSFQNFTYLPLKKFIVQPKTLRFKTTKGTTAEGTERISIVNQGNVPITISLSTKDLQGKNGTITQQNLYFINDRKQTPIHGTTLTVTPGTQKDISLLLNVPTTITTGLYTSLVRFLSE